MVKVLRAGGAVVSPIDESRIALMNAVENSNFAAIKTIVNQQTPGSDCAIALKAVLVKNSDSIPLWLKNNCSFSEADQKDIFVLVLKKRNIPLLDIFKDWGIAALQRGEGNHFFSHSTSSWDVNVWLLNNQFVVESSRLDDLTADRFWENKDDNTAGLHRLFKDKVFNVDNPIICKAIPSLFPLEHSGVIKPAMKASDINYVRKFMSCYSKEEIQKVIVNIDLHRHLDNFDTANVRMVLALIADWTPYILTHHPSNRTPDFYSRYPDKLPIKVEIEEMLKKSNIQIAQ